MHIDTISYIPLLFQKMFSYFGFKLISVISYIIVYPFFDVNHSVALFALFFLILIDSFTGLVAAWKTNTEIKSAKIFRTALKVSIYFTLVASGHLAELAGLSLIPIDETLIAILAATELISILENSAAMGYVIPQKLLNKLRQFKNDQ